MCNITFVFIWVWKFSVSVYIKNIKQDTWFSNMKGSICT
jgi:hypothetical protein